MNLYICFNCDFPGFRLGVFFWGQRQQELNESHSYSSLFAVIFFGKTTFKRVISGKVFNFPWIEFSVPFKEEMKDKDSVWTQDLNRNIGYLHATSEKNWGAVSGECSRASFERLHWSLNCILIYYASSIPLPSQPWGLVTQKGGPLHSNSLPIQKIPLQEWVALCRARKDMSLVSDPWGIFHARLQKQHSNSYTLQETISAWNLLIWQATKD